MQADGNTRGVVAGIIDGTRQILFLMIPMALYLMVFSTPLVTLYHIGAFTADAIGQIASYLAVMAVALPFYGVNAYLNKIFSSIRRMGVFSVINFVAVAAQVAVTLGAAWAYQQGLDVTLESIAASTIVSYVIGDVIAFAYLRRHFGPMGLGAVMRSFFVALALGGAGAVVVQAVLFAALHGSWTARAYGLGMGLIFGWAAQKAKSVWPGSALHIINNCLVFAARLAERGMG